MSPIPTALSELVPHLVSTARELLEQSGTLHPFVFVGNSQTKELTQIPVDVTSTESKQASANHMRMVAAMQEADFALHIMNGWSLPKEKLANYAKILEKYGSIGNSPYRVDVVQFLLETHDGIWRAEVEVRQRSRSKTKKTFGDVNLSKVPDEAEAVGIFGNILPKKRPPSATVH